MRAKGPKCKSCGKQIQLMSYGAGYLKVVVPGEARAKFFCQPCAEGLLGRKLAEL